MLTERYRLALEEIKREAVPSVNLSAHNNVQALARIESLAAEALSESDPVPRQLPMAERVLYVRLHRGITYAAERLMKKRDSSGAEWMALLAILRGDGESTNV